MPITLDGSFSDWTAADRLDFPGSSVSGYELYGRYEAGSYVFALSAAVSIGANTTFWLNTDRDRSTGYQVFGFAAGAEYNINFDAAGVPHLYTGADGQTLVGNAIVDYAYNAAGTGIEFTISAAQLDGTQALNVYVDVNNQVLLPTSYDEYAYTVAAPAVVGEAILDGSLSEWTAADRIDGSFGQAGYEIYARVTGGNYVIAIKSPTPISLNTTAWLNTDQNAATGFQIFGSTGGAEYNVNFDASGDAMLFTGNAGETAIANGDIVERYSADKTVVEFAIPKELLGFTGAPGAISTLYDLNDSVFLPTQYSATQYIISPPGAPVVVGTMTLDGTLTDWTAANCIDGVAPVAGFEVYGRTSGDSYVFAIHSTTGISIGTNTTAWLNTDQDVGTGFDIFAGSPAEGGAEYNINFDVAGVPHLYTGAAGEVLVPGSEVLFARSSDGSTVEFAIAKTAIGSPAAINTLFDVNNATFLPGSYTGPAYTVFDVAGLPERTDFSQKVAIVYSHTSAARYFGNANVNVNETGYSQLFMAAQNQAAMAGVPYDLLTEADLTNLANLINYDAIIFPSFQFVNSADLRAISNNLTLLAQNYNTSFIAAGNFMTTDQNGAVLAGDPYANMKALFDVQPQAGGFAGTTSVAIKSAGTGFAGVNGYVPNEAIHTYNNAAGVGWLAFTDATAGTTPLAVIDNQTVTGTGAGTYAAVVASSINGDRNVHFSTEALLGDNNQLWQAIEYAVNGATGPSVGLQLGRQSSIVASRNDMDQSRFADEVTPPSGANGIYDELLPILQQWKTTYNFVGSYYINIGDNAQQQEQTIWAESLPYYLQLLAMGNEIGSHSLTHLGALAPAEDTNILTTGSGPGTFDYEFRLSRDVIQANIGAAVLGYQISGAAVPGAPEFLSTAEQIIPYYDYLSGGYSSVGAGYPGAFGYLTPAHEHLGKVYLAPNMSFDFTLIEWQGKTAAQALAAWQAEFASLTSHADIPVVVWPWHDYGPADWDNGGYTQAMFTDFIATAANAGAEFVTLEDLADRIRSFDQASVTSSVSGNVVTATVTSSEAGKFALDLDNLGTQVISSVAGWYAYDNDSVFTDRNGGTYAITLGDTAVEATHITKLAARSELVSLFGDGTNLSFTLAGEGQVVVDLNNAGGHAIVVTGATVVGQVGDILTLDVGSIGTHTVDIKVSVSPINITSNGGGATAAVSVAENGTAVTTVTASHTDAGATLSYAIVGGGDGVRFSIGSNTGVLSFVSAPDHENPTDAGADNVYDVVVAVSDGANSDSQAIAVTVGNLNDNAPVISSGGGGATAAVSVVENGTAVTTVTASDADAGATLTYEIVGGADAALFDLNATSGLLTFKTAPDFEAPQDVGINNVYDVIVKASDDGTIGSDTQALAITVTNVNGLNYQGTAAANIVSATPEDDTLNGAGGNDTLSGLVGADTLSGGAGADVLNGGLGNDFYLYASTAQAAAGENIVEASGGGIDTLHTTATASLVGLTVNGSADLEGADTDEGIEQILIQAGTTATFSGAQLSGNDIAVNEFAAGTTKLVINVASGATSSFASLTFAAVAGGDAFDNGTDTITINGAAGVETITGTNFADTLSGGAGADVLNGGLGNDFYLYASTAQAAAGENIVEVSGGGIDTLQTTATASLIGLTVNGSADLEGADTDEGIEQILIQAGTTATFSGAQLSGNDIAVNEFAAGTTKLVINVASGATSSFASLTFAAVAGGDAFDNGTDTITINGAAGVETITGTNFADTLSGGAGADVLNGGLGNDFYLYASTAQAAAGENIVEASGGGIDTLHTTATASLIGLTVNGSADLEGADTDEGIEQILIQAGTTATFSGAQLSGNDIAVNESAAGTTKLVINVASGATSSFASLTFAAVAGGDAFDNGTDTITINGAAGVETITGTNFADTLSGGAGADVLNGGAGNDRLTGSAGVDVLTGGLGADTFVFASTADIGNGTVAGSRELVTDFVVGVDRFDFSAIDANTGAGGNQAFTLLTENASISAAAQLRWYFDAANNETIIEGNVNANLTPDFKIALAGQIALTGGDFIL